jgi:hypothetical protein
VSYDEPEWVRANCTLKHEARQLKAALERACDETDYCYVCDMHPSSGHADGCLLEV